MSLRPAVKACALFLAAAAALVAVLHVLGVRGPLEGLERLVTRADVDASPHRAGRVKAHGVDIDYLDWGGRGRPLVFIPGFGSSAHVFDDFAPRFADSFRVVGLTRVGFGEGEPPEKGYDLASRIEQMRAVLDSLGLARVVLAGHSLGGDELTGFAGKYPERTLGLVYLDAAYDHVEIIQAEGALERYASLAPKPTPADLAGARAYQAWRERDSGIRYPLGEILARQKLDWKGRVLGSRTPGRVFEATDAAVEPPDYARVRAPALALYSDWETAADFFPWLRTDKARNARYTEVLRGEILPMTTAQRERFAREVKGAQVVTIRAHHYSFLSHPAEVERTMRAFLGSLPQPN